MMNSMKILESEYLAQRLGVRIAVLRIALKRKSAVRSNVDQNKEDTDVAGEECNRCTLL